MSELAGWGDIETVDTDILFSHFKDMADNWNNMVKDEIFIGADSIEKTRICEFLIAEMIQRGERDNISVGIIYCI